MMPVARIPLSALRVADGKIAITLSIHDLDPVSLLVEPQDVEKIVSGVDISVREDGGSRSSEKTHVLVRQAVDLAMHENDVTAQRGAMLSVLWLARNHPHHSEEVRAGMSQALRAEGRAHLSVAVDARRSWGFALASRWVDLSTLLSAIPPGQEVSACVAQLNEEKPGH
jgi:hypothetical protein